MGLGNIVSGLFGSMPGSASFARSAANFQSDARSQVAGLLSSLCVLVFVAALFPLVNHLPVPALLLPLDVAIYFDVVLALFLALRQASTPTLVE